MKITSLWQKINEQMNSHIVCVFSGCFSLKYLNGSCQRVNYSKFREPLWWVLGNAETLKITESLGLCLLLQKLLKYEDTIIYIPILWHYFLSSESFHISIVQVYVHKCV